MLPHIELSRISASAIEYPVSVGHEEALAALGVMLFACTLYDATCLGVCRVALCLTFRPPLTLGCLLAIKSWQFRRKMMYVNSPRNTEVFFIMKPLQPFRVVTPVRKEFGVLNRSLKVHSVPLRALAPRENPLLVEVKAVGAGSISRLRQSVFRALAACPC